LSDSEGELNESVLERLLRALSAAASSMCDICARENMAQFAPFWASVARVASTLAEEPTRQHVQRLVRDVLSAYRYVPGGFVDMYIVRAEPESQLQENETFDELREKIRRLAIDLDDVATDARS
jgi:hypothetical protein